MSYNNQATQLELREFVVTTWGWDVHISFRPRLRHCISPPIQSSQDLGRRPYGAELWSRSFQLCPRSCRLISTPIWPPSIPPEFRSSWTRRGSTGSGSSSRRGWLRRSGGTSPVGHSSGTWTEWEAEKLMSVDIGGNGFCFAGRLAGVMWTGGGYG